jgi:hypothetical protein
LGGSAIVPVLAALAIYIVTLKHQVQRLRRWANPLVLFHT